MSDTLVNFFTNILSGIIPKEAIVLIISMMPILELRGGLLAASLLHIQVYKAVIVCIVGNLIPIPFILRFITSIMEWMKTKEKLKKIVFSLEEKSQRKSEKIQKYEFWGLLFFVGIPLPGTGAWTGALIASLLKINSKKAFTAIIGGVFMASVIMVAIAYGIPALISIL